MYQVTVAQADVCKVGFPVPEGVFADGVLLGVANVLLSCC